MVVHIRNTLIRHLIGISKLTVTTCANSMPLIDISIQLSAKEMMMLLINGIDTTHTIEI